MEIKYNKTSTDNMPEECRVVLCKYSDDDGEVLGLMTVIDGEWVTDASESELYGAISHSKIHTERLPYEWAYID